MLSLGRVVLSWRNHRGLSQADLARRSGVPRSNLSNIERGKKDVSLQTLRMLAAALDVTPGALADGIPPEPESLSQPANELTRETMERIARAVHTGRNLVNPRHQALVNNLKIVAGPRLRALNPKYPVSRRIGRKTERAWLELSVLPPLVRDSLIQRAIEHAPLSQPQAH